MNLYQTRWSVFRRWCKIKETSAYAMSVTLLLLFYRFLFEKKKLKYITVVGYRASLRDFMLALELPEVRHPLITCLFAATYQEDSIPKLQGGAYPWC